MQNKLTLLSFSIISIFLVGCGGGGGSSSEPVVTEQPNISSNMPNNVAVLPNIPNASNSIYQEMPDILNCREGILAEQVKQNIVLRLNLIRALHGLSPVTYDYQHDQQVMRTALMMSANNDLNHVPPPSWKCYNVDGAQGAQTSNLYLEGGSGIDQNNLLALENDLIAWLIDFGVESSGHRRWLLDPFLHKVAYGSVAGSVGGQQVRTSVLKVIYNDQRDGNSAQQIIAYPMGDYPKAYYKEGTYLSLSLALDSQSLYENIKVDFSKVQMTVKQRNGTEMTIHSITSNNDGMGLPNHLQFKVDQLQNNQIYDVHLSNVLVNGVARSYDYWFRLQ